MKVILRAGSHKVPSLTYVSKSQHGAKVPTCEFQVITKNWLNVIKVESLLFMQKYLWDLG